MIGSSVDRVVTCPAPCREGVGLERTYGLRREASKAETPERHPRDGRRRAPAANVRQARGQPVAGRRPAEVHQARALARKSLLAYAESELPQSVVECESNDAVDAVGLRREDNAGVREPAAVVVLGKLLAGRILQPE